MVNSEDIPEVPLRPLVWMGATTMTEETVFEESSGNVFADLGLEDAAIAFYSWQDRDSGTPTTERA